MTRSTRAIAVLLALCSCNNLEEIPKDQPCLEAGFAIARRTFECTGDGDLANARFERFRKQFECIDLPEYVVDTGRVTKFVQVEDSGQPAVFPPDHYHCAVAIDGLACETVDQFGDDIAQYLATSDACAWVTKPKGSR